MTALLRCALGATVLWIACATLAAADAPVASPPAATNESAPPDHDAPAASVPAPASFPSVAVRVGFDESIEPGAMALYRVGSRPAAGVVSRSPYLIRYELLRLTAYEATLARTTLTLDHRTLAREVFTVRRYLRTPRETAPAGAATAPEEQACSVEGQTVACRVVRQTTRENGRACAFEWALSPSVPLTGLVYAKRNGQFQLELLAFSRGGEAGTQALAAATHSAAQAAAAAPSEPAALTAARERNATEHLPPGAVIVDPRTGVIVTVPELEVPVLPPGDTYLEGQPAAESSSAPAPSTAGSPTPPAPTTPAIP